MRGWEVKKGDRIAQLIIESVLDLPIEELIDLSSTERRSLEVSVVPGSKIR